MLGNKLGKYFVTNVFKLRKSKHSVELNGVDMKLAMVITLLIISSDVFSQVRGTTWGDITS